MPRGRSDDNPRNLFSLSFASVLWTLKTLSLAPPMTIWISVIIKIFLSLYPFYILLIHKQYMHILSVGTCLCVLFNATCMYIKCFYMCIWAYLAFSSVYSMLVNHGYINASIGPWWAGIRLNILPTTQQSECFICIFLPHTLKTKLFSKLEYVWDVFYLEGYTVQSFKYMVTSLGKKYRSNYSLFSYR